MVSIFKAITNLIQTGFRKKKSRRDFSEIFFLVFRFILSKMILIFFLFLFPSLFFSHCHSINLFLSVFSRSILPSLPSHLFAHCFILQVSLITKKVPEGSMTTVYKCGPLIDLCMGPHVSTTGKIKVSYFFT